MGHCGNCGEFWVTCSNCHNVFPDYVEYCPVCGRKSSGVVPYAAVLYFSREHELEIRVWHEDTPESERFTALEEPVSALSCSHDGSLLCATMESGAVRVWSTEMQLELPPVSPARAGPLVVEFHRRLPLLYTATRGVLQLWSYDTEAVLSPAVLPRGRRKILVVGTSLYELPSPVIHMARALGDTLAAAGFDLVSGGCRGVDYLVTEAYIHLLHSRQEDVGERLTQVVEQWRDPDLSAGRVERVPGETEWRNRVADAADAIVVIGGQDGSRNIASEFIRRRKLVVPLPGTGAAASDLWNELVESDSEWGPLIRSLTLPVENQPHADCVSTLAIAVLQVALDATPEMRSEAVIGLLAPARFHGTRRGPARPAGNGMALESGSGS